MATARTTWSPGDAELLRRLEERRSAYAKQYQSDRAALMNQTSASTFVADLMLAHADAVIAVLMLYRKKNGEASA